MRFALVETNQTLPVMMEVVLAGGERLRIPCEASALRLVLGILKEARHRNSYQQSGLRLHVR